MSEIEHVKNRILSKSPLDVLIGGYVNLQKRSGRFLGCCPFHEEKTPSFYLYTDHYHCFGCGAHGDAITFVQKIQGLSFIESLRWLAQKFSIPATELDRSKLKIKDWQKNNRLSKVLVEAQEYFVQNLHLQENKEAQDYLLARGFEESSWKHFGFGYAPDFPNQLIKALTARGYTLKELESVSLANVFEHKSYDFFRHRIIIPIRDTYGRLIAFGGRALGDQQQKYKNSRFDKSTNLFGLDKARKVMRSKLRGIVVEGYLDALKMHQNGFIETVACQGTALTKEHIRALRSATNMIYLLFDGDNAGVKASLKLISMSLDYPEVQFKVVELPSGDDPDNFLTQHGPEQLEERIKNAKDLIDFAIDKKIQDCHSSAIPGLINNEFIPWLTQVEDPIQKSFLINKISRLTGVEKKIILDAQTNKIWRDEKGQEFSENKLEKKNETDSSKDESEKLSKLDGLIFEFLGHLFYASIEDNLNINQISEFIKSSLRIDETWIVFARELITALENGLTPNEQDPCRWVSSQSSAVMDLIQKLESQKRAFTQVNRNMMIQRLILLDKRNKIKSDINSIQENLILLRSKNQNPDTQEIKRLGDTFMLAHKELKKIQVAINKTR